MCDPVTITAAATATVAAISTTAGFMGAQQAAKDNKTAANLTAANSFNDLSARGRQIDQQNSENILSNLIDAHAAQGAISASASAYGTGEATTQQLSNAAQFAAGRNAEIDQLNSDDQRLQLASDRVGVGMRRQSQINSKLAPSGLSLALGYAQDAIGGVNEYHSLGGKF